MASHYKIVQYIPDPIVDERVNIGVLTFGDGKVRSKFISNWTRVAQFGGRRDLPLLHETVSALAAATEAEVKQESPAPWATVIQLTEPRASLLDPDALLHEVAERFLRSTAVPVRAARTHQQAASFAKQRVKEILINKIGREAADLVRNDVVAQGGHTKHKIDVGVANGKLIGGVFALSFEVERGLDREIRATAFSLEDLRETFPNLPIAVSALPPRDDTKQLFFFARDLFPQFSVPIMVENEIDGWINELVPAAAASTSTSH